MPKAASGAYLPATTLGTSANRLTQPKRPILTTERIQPVDVVQNILADLRTVRDGRHVEIVLGELPPCDADPIPVSYTHLTLPTNREV